MICRTDDLDNVELQGGKCDAGESEKSLERFYSGKGEDWPNKQSASTLFTVNKLLISVIAVVKLAGLLQMKKEGNYQEMTALIGDSDQKSG